jgi:hypothetical protein
MKLDKINKTYIIIAIVIVLIIVLAVVILLSRTKIPGNAQEIIVQKDNGTLVVNRNGQVTFTFGDSVYVDQWSQDKTSAFFDYIYNKYGDSDELSEPGFPGSVTFTLGGEEKTVPVGGDELIDVVIDDTTEGGDGGDGGGDEGGDGGEDIGDYFSSPTPNPSAGGTSGPTPTPYSGTDPHPNCLYWKLSYCAQPRPSAPPVTPAPSGEVIEAADCDEWNAQQGDNTIINNTVCIPSQ